MGDHAMRVQRLLDLARCVVALLACLALFDVHPAWPAQPVYVCPPCGATCDAREYDQPGKCPSCGMTLVVRSEATALAAANIVRGRVVILLFPGVDIIDYSGPWEVFGAARYDVVTVAATPALVQTFYGQVVKPDYTFANCPAADVLLVPGGNVPSSPDADSTLDWIRRQSKKSRITFSVCNGAYWLAGAGLLDGRAATTMYGMTGALAMNYPKIHVVADRRVVEDGPFVTTAGLSAGIDGAIHVVATLNGESLARLTALGLEYDWRPESPYVRANLADKYLARLGAIPLPKDVRRQRVDARGDTERWDETWRVTVATTTPKDVMATIEKTLRAASWDLIATTAGEPCRSEWRFKGDDGSTWTAVFAISREADHLLERTTLRKS
jgi:putative intracellular protease/amidase/DNA-directed RNA polymerase subunit RPC12/RpoP